MLAAVRYMMNRLPKGARVLLCGTSVGGASVVYAAARDPSNLMVKKEKTKTKNALTLPSHRFLFLKGVICENPVAHPERFIADHMTAVLSRLSPAWFWPVCKAFVSITTVVFLYRIGLLFNRHDGAAAHKVRDLQVPIFVMHGTADEIVPLEHGLEMVSEREAVLFALAAVVLPSLPFFAV